MKAERAARGSPWQSPPPQRRGRILVACWVSGLRVEMGTISAWGSEVTDHVENLVGMEWGVEDKSWCDNCHVWEMLG